MSIENFLHQTNKRYSESKNIFGFWVYIMSDCVLFAILLAVYAVLHGHTFDGPTAKELFNNNLYFVLIETLLLLTSSFSYGLAMLSYKISKNKVIQWIMITFIIGSCFITMEIYEFYSLYDKGHNWAVSAFLSSFFTLVGAHGLHVLIGLIWIAVMSCQVNKRGITPTTKKKLTYLGLFWHFLDIIWIFIFSIVYLMGSI